MEAVDGVLFEGGALWEAGGSCALDATPEEACARWFPVRGTCPSLSEMRERPGNWNFQGVTDGGGDHRPLAMYSRLDSRDNPPSYIVPHDYMSRAWYDPEEDSGPVLLEMMLQLDDRVCCGAMVTDTLAWGDATLMRCAPPPSW